jgi:L-fuculose-phosphate aldolase
VSNGEYSAQLIAVGKELYNRRLQTTRSGNISIRDGERFLITQTGANLGQLLESNFIHVDISQGLPIPPEASCESPLHRAIYDATEALAIVHAHPIHAIALAQISCDDHILPIHNEGLAGLKRIPIVDTTVLGLGIGEEPTAIAAALRQSCSVVVRGHGAFAIGRSLDQKWSRFFEQFSPIYKWVPGGLSEVQSCPRRRAALATDRPPRWATRGAPRISC